MKRIATLGLATLTILVAVCAVWTWHHFRTPLLTKAELARSLRPPAAPRRLKEGCPELKKAIELAASPSPSNPKRSIKNATPLSEDEVAIYRAVLAQATRREGTHLNVSVTTEPLTPQDLDHCECLEDIQLENLAAVFHSYHQLSTAGLATKQVRLVDRDEQSSQVRANDPSATIREGKSVKEAVDAALATGLFSMSEIAFDKEHHYAVVSYGFWCGMLCGNGETLVLEKEAGKWTKTERTCGGWIS